MGHHAVVLVPQSLLCYRPSVRCNLLSLTGTPEHGAELGFMLEQVGTIRFLDGVS